MRIPTILSSRIHGVMPCVRRVASVCIAIFCIVTSCMDSSCQGQGTQRTHMGAMQSPHSLPEHPMERAGNPLCISPLARCFPDANYKGYSVGGGAAWRSADATVCRGECRYINEGTFGVDYAPWYSRVQLRWFHGRKQQGGEGQYEPDGYNNPLDDHFGFGPWKKAPNFGIHHH